MSGLLVAVGAPFESWSFCAQSALFSAALATYIVFGFVMSRNAKAMKARGAGIVELQRAGSPKKAHMILTDWGVDGRRAARLDLVLDLGLIVGYSVGLSVAFSSAVAGVADAADCWWVLAARLLAWLSVFAGVTDLLENVLLAIILARYTADPKKMDGLPRATCYLSTVKFSALALCAGWAVLVLWPLLVP